MAIGPHRSATLFPLTALLGTDRVRKGTLQGALLSDAEARVGLNCLDRVLPPDLQPILDALRTLSGLEGILP